MPTLTFAIFVFAMQAAHRPVPPPGSLRPTVAFGGSGQNTITAMTSDTAGNVYIAGTTSSPNLPLEDQSVMESMPYPLQLVPKD